MCPVCGHAFVSCHSSQDELTTGSQGQAPHAHAPSCAALALLRASLAAAVAPRARTSAASRQLGRHCALRHKYPRCSRSLSALSSRIRASAVIHRGRPLRIKYQSKPPTTTIQLVYRIHKSRGHFCPPLAYFCGSRGGSLHFLFSSNGSTHLRFFLSFPFYLRI